jgi:energy-coupling factor transport system ATP-binding protein
MRLELRDVRHVYARGTPFEVEALRGTSVVVEPGEVLGIVGGTGSGKSTLVQHMNLLLTPTSGQVLVDGVDATALEKGELRRRVGLVFQFPEAALFAQTVEEDVAFAPRRLGLDEGEVRDRVRDSLEAVGAGHLVGRSPFALSGGEKRRVAVAERADWVCVRERGEVRAVGTPAEVFYGDPDLAPATVQTVVALGEAPRRVGRPVTFRETLAALRALAGD